MSDLISRQAAIDAVEALAPHSLKYVMEEEGHGFCTGLAVAERQLELLPTIDAVPVKHGVWSYGSEIAREYRVDGVHIYYEKCFCSICGYEENYKPYWNYCPNCGAKMDEVGE